MQTNRKGDNMNSKLKKTLMSVMLGSMSFLLFSCGGMLQIGTPTPSEEEKESTSETIKPGTSDEQTQLLSQQEKIYQLAKASGYQGTYEQWLESIKGDQVVIAVVNNALQWRYTSDSQWTMLIDLSDLKGEDGHTPYIGKNGNWWINGTDTGVYAGGQSGEPTKEMHSVTFHYEDGTSYSVDVEFGRTVDYVEGKYIPGKQFVGWYYEGTDQEWMFDFYSVTKDINLYSYYENAVYTMYLEGFGSQPVCYGEYFDLPEMNQEGYKFIGWEYNGRIYDIGTYEFTYDISLTPKWEKIENAGLTDLESALVNVVEGKTCYLTTVGQADSDVVGIIFKRAGAIGAYETQTMLKASDVEEGSVVFLTLGSSSKGLGVAGVDEAFERARAAEFAAAASEGKFTLILFHVGGTARRGTSSDPIIEAVFPGADACFVVSSGNEDAFFTNLASTNNVSLYEVEKAIELVDYAKGLFGTE
jgi:hypothetical protein